MLAKPVAQQIQEIRPALDSKTQQSTSIRQEIEAFNSKLQVVTSEGLSLERPFMAAEQRLTQEPVTQPVPMESGSSPSEALSQVEQLFGMLPPETLQPFIQSLSMPRSFVDSGNWGVNAAENSSCAEVVSGVQPLLEQQQQAHHQQ